MALLEFVPWKDFYLCFKPVFRRDHTIKSVVVQFAKVLDPVFILFYLNAWGWGWYTLRWCL